MSFNAKFRGACSECDDPILPGQEVEYTTDDDLVHVICPEDDNGTGGTTSRPVCDSCWTELPLSLIHI